MTRSTTHFDRRRRDDARLVRACRRGDASAWTELIERYRRLIYSIPVGAYRMRESDAEEIFQTVVVKLFEHLGRLRAGTSLAAWIGTVTRNECRRFYRRARRWDPRDLEDGLVPAVDPPDVVGALDDVEREHRLALAFRMLDDASRQLLHAMYVETPTPSYAELARRLGRPIGSLGPTRARCLSKLRRLYVGLGGSADEVAGAAALRSQANALSLAS